MSSNITKQEAEICINKYRQNLPQDAMRSVWLDQDIINFIVANAQSKNINGLRIYLAEKPAESTEDGNDTMIAVPTTDVDGVDTDIDSGYFNYGRRCPSKCAGSIGN